YIADTENDRVRRILNAAPTLSVTPTTLNLTVQAGTPATALQQIAVSSPVIGIQWSTRTSTSNGGSSLRPVPVSGATPGSIGVTVDATNLSPGTYQGTITVNAPLATPATQAIPVTLTVSAALPAQLFVNSASLTFQALQASGNPGAQILRIGNAG